MKLSKIIHVEASCQPPEMMVRFHEFLDPLKQYPNDSIYSRCSLTPEICRKLDRDVST